MVTSDVIHSLSCWAVTLQPTGVWGSRQSN